MMIENANDVNDSATNDCTMLSGDLISIIATPNSDAIEIVIMIRVCLLMMI
jgi:hypothetical protein